MTCCLSLSLSATTHKADGAFYALQLRAWRCDLFDATYASAYSLVRDVWPQLLPIQRTAGIVKTRGEERAVLRLGTANRA